jgi:hypothetical protein
MSMVGRKHRKSMLAVVSMSLVGATALSLDVQAKKEFATFDLQVEFINGTKSMTNAALESTVLKPWIAEAETQFVVKPVLKIHYTVRRQTTEGGQDLSNLQFDHMADFGKFMDDHFDNVARTETDGHLTILVGEELCWKNLLGKSSCWGGYSQFPHDVNPFNRKKGIWLSATKSTNHTMSHELGHVFGLKHTFEAYVGLNKQCNREFSNKNLLNPLLGHCNSCTGKIVTRGEDRYACEGGVSNVMDYCSSLMADAAGAYTVPGPETLNVCQQERAATQRSQYLTKDGKVNYVQLAGLRREGACSSDT